MSLVWNHTLTTRAMEQPFRASRLPQPSQALHLSFHQVLRQFQSRTVAPLLTLSAPPLVQSVMRERLVAPRGLVDRAVLTREVAADADTGNSIVVHHALSQLGKPYRFGANDFGPDPAAFDCSSFVKWLYQHQGVVLPRTAQQQYDVCEAVPASQARPGDLVFFRNTYATSEHVTHVGVVLDSQRMISASDGGVRIDSLTSPYWSARLVGFGRPAMRPSAPDHAGAANQLPAFSLIHFPRPPQDNGRGLHWIPTTSSPPDVVDRFIREAVEMGARWMVFLNDGTRIGANDYLVGQLVAHGIMPIMRVYTPHGEPIQGDLRALVRHYVALGVPYFQLYNEPNLASENPDGQPNVERYVDWWLRAARDVVAAGGLPGFGALAPGGDYDDRAFLRQALGLLKHRAERGLLDRTWLAIHNYTFNQPLDHDSDTYGFMAFKVYDRIVRETLGWSLPIIGTEGGSVLGNQLNRERPPVTEEWQARMAAEIYRYMAQRREPYNFAYTTWVIANRAGGGLDPGFEGQALILPERARPVVATLKQLT